MTMLDELLVEMKKRCWPEPTWRGQCSDICCWFGRAERQRRSLMCKQEGGWIKVVADLMDHRNETRVVETIHQAARFLDVFRQRLKPGEIPCLDPVFVKLFGTPVPPRAGDTGRPVCVPPMERRGDCQNERSVAPVADSEVSAAQRGTPDPYPSQPVSDHDRELDIRMWVSLKRVPGWSPDPAIVEDLRFLLRRLDDLRDSFRHPDPHSPQPPDPQPAHDWIAQLDRPYQPPI